MPDAEQCNAPSPRALIVDDNPVMRVVLSSLLTRRGYAVTEEASAESALRGLGEAGFDLIFLDILLTGMSGVELCQIIRSDLGLHGLPIVAYTSHGDLVGVPNMKMAGFSGFLFKPVDGRALDSLLEQLGRPAADEPSREER